MPKLGNGLDYFQLQTNMNDDQKLELLEAEFGIKGFGIWVKILRKIYADEGWFMRWNKDTKLLFAKRVGEPGSFVDEVVKGSVRRGLFDESVFDQFNILTSKHIQEHYFASITRRSTDMEVDPRFLVISEDEHMIRGNANIKMLNANISTQSRVEESRVDNIQHNVGARVDSSETDEPENRPQHKPDAVEDVVTFFGKNGSSEKSARDFYDHYASQGWVKGNGMAISSWHSAASKWIRNEKNKSQKYQSVSKIRNGRSKDVDAEGILSDVEAIFEEG